MDWVWTWGGTCFGYLRDGNLWTHSGKHVGVRHGDEIYGRSGDYLGEVMSENRLIRNLGKSGWRAASFTPFGRVGGYTPFTNYTGYAMYSGHEDFPGPDTF